MDGFHHVPFAAAAQIEATAYSAETLTVADDAIPVYSAKITPAIARNSDRLRSPKGGRLGGIVTSRRATWSVEAPLYGLGLSGGNIVLPRYVSQIIQTAFSLDTSSDVTACVATPNPHAPDLNGTAAKETFTFGTWIGQKGTIAAGKKVYRQAHGCRINTLKIGGKVGEIVKVMMEGPGLYNEDTDVTTDLSGFDPDSWSRSLCITPNQMGLTIGGQAVSITEFELGFEFGAGHEDASDDSDGVAGTFVTDTTVSLTVRPRLLEQSTYDLFNLVHAGTQVALAMGANGIFPDSQSGNTGYGWKFAAAAATPGGTEYSEDTPIRLPLTFDVEKGSVLADEASMTWL